MSCMLCVFLGGVETPAFPSGNTSVFLSHDVGVVFLGGSPKMVVILFGFSSNH